MSIKANFRVCVHFWGFLLSLLILLLCILSKGGIAAEQKFWDEAYRVLNLRKLPLCKNLHLGNYSIDCKIDLKNNLINLKNLLESDEAQIPCKISREELKKRIAYCRFFFVCKKKAPDAIYAYIHYLRVKYYNMIYGLKKTFLELASENELPEDVQKIYWGQCEDELLKELQVMENVSEKYFQALMDNKLVLTMHFNWAMGSHETYWYSEMFKKELKWSAILSDWANNYTPRSEEISTESPQFKSQIDE
ncbi:Plasmodium exported protein, unknown function [Plasmodium knowlesi strain H]|uniref:Plasmodium RESA N-terminal domain-containing protein n=3 Tax=Plasmodium knowlesi TaxID=5850 RepID=A0A1A7VXB0_PLAKH|nr:Plasmodium exported protein (PHIST), unknown function [Plasmodium knowlesi strain H]OTN68127.1 Uncharacterized protein PKNOH_S04361100 [Plasmodium knowlesi]CAA9986971.1 Plasmodium exported protein (PHIST), unknown function [Plasmodium knowlesi strain H]SBO26595.1 Plasmodium exported protein, unknown function [Plasmodium knowlesi strain H]SBO28177.1 Plasmodium exported protein, unknown function [Plasmodium knowlesi strain H]VVS76445.1 Plasmodium exported protein (PHIST), unknown function [Pl